MKGPLQRVRARREPLLLRGPARPLLLKRAYLGGSPRRANRAQRPLGRERADQDETPLREDRARGPLVHARAYSHVVDEDLEVERAQWMLAKNANQKQRKKNQAVPASSVGRVERDTPVSVLVDLGR